MQQFLTVLTLGVAFAAGAQAQPLTPKAQFAADSKAAAARYEEDKRLCSEEAGSAARLQCRRDAKAEYEAALAAARGRLAATPVAAPSRVGAQAACEGCGKVTAVAVKEEPGKGGPTGLIAGGLGGAILGRQIGGGSGKDIATIAGAVGGAYAGKKIEEKMTAHQVWTVTVQYQDGSSSSFAFDQDPGFKVGDPVRNAGSGIVRRSGSE